MDASRKVGGRWDDRRPNTVWTGRCGEQHRTVKADQQFLTDQTIAVNGIEIIQAPEQFPRVAARGITIFIDELQRHPRTVRKEERCVSFTTTIVSLRRNLCKEGVVAEVKDIGHLPIKGEVTVGIRDQTRQHNPFDDQLDIVV